MSEQKPIIERFEEEVKCTLPDDNNYSIRFFLLDLSDEEYIKRTRLCLLADQERSVGWGH